VQVTQQSSRDDKALKREAYGAATSRLRDKYRSEFNTLMQEEASKRNIDWRPRPTEVQKAEQQLNDLLAQFPELATRFSDATE
jgi:hypothetical protein